jgi:hypothetical protein
LEEQFYGTDENEEDIELQEALERTMAFRQALKVAKWKQAYDAHKPVDE